MCLSTYSLQPPHQKGQLGWKCLSHWEWHKAIHSVLLQTLNGRESLQVTLGKGIASPVKKAEPQGAEKRLVVSPCSSPSTSSSIIIVLLHNQWGAINYTPTHFMMPMTQSMDTSIFWVHHLMTWLIQLCKKQKQVKKAARDSNQPILGLISFKTGKTWYGLRQGSFTIKCYLSFLVWQFMSSITRKCQDGAPEIGQGCLTLRSAGRIKITCWQFRSCAG